MRSHIITALMISVLSVAAPNFASAKASLQTVTEVENGLFAISVADKIRRECGSISGRLMKAHGRLRALYAVARDAGYSDAEIAAMKDNGSI